MIIFCIVNRKGGVGKSTIAFHLGVELSNRGYYTVMMDTDPLSSLAETCEERVKPEPQLITVPIDELEAAIPRLRDVGVEYLIIDTPGFEHEDINHILKLATLNVVISKAGPLDLRATRKTVHVIKEVDVPMVFVLNEVHKSTNIAGQSIIALSQHGKLGPVINWKTDFANAMIDGRTIGELSPGCDGAVEITALTDYLLMEVGVHVENPVIIDPLNPPARKAGKKAAKEAVKSTSKKPAIEPLKLVGKG